MAGAAANLISSTRVDQKPSFSADGKKIVFSSDRSGTPEIWICEVDGSNPIQLTALEHVMVDNPRWSPDGRQIVFDSTNRGNSDIYLIGPQGGKPRLLAGSAAEDFMAKFFGEMADGFTSVPTGEARFSSGKCRQMEGKRFR